MEKLLNIFLKIVQILSAPNQVLLILDVEMEKSKTISSWGPNWRSAIKQSNFKYNIFVSKK
jgi:hypothetical protein